MSIRHSLNQGLYRAVPCVLLAAACLDATAIADGPLFLTPPWAVLSPGDTMRFTIARDSVHLAETRAFASSDTTIIDIDTSGFARGVRTGNATIHVSSGPYAAAAEVAVVPPVLIGAGDIAVCGSRETMATAAIVKRISGIVFTAGDNAYQDGTSDEFARCYDPWWGQFRVRTRPSLGAHDYHTPDAAGYFGYFKTSAGPTPLGYYSYDLGNWHVIVLNTNIDISDTSTQLRWLRADLDAHPSLCTAAYWYLPRFSSGRHGSAPALTGVWQILFDAGVELVISGHDHDYERFAPQRPDGALDGVHGIRQFVVGTGGAELTAVTSMLPNSEVAISVWGVLKLDLEATNYRWEFLTVPGDTVRDSGTDACHGPGALEGALASQDRRNRLQENHDVAQK